MKHQKLETTETISKRMGNVSLKGGKSETALAKALWKEGLRYRKNYKRLPGSPDIAITKYKVAVFVDGEFWHGENWAERKTRLKSNKDYWIEKIEENIARDRKLKSWSSWSADSIEERQEVLYELSKCSCTVKKQATENNR